MARITDDEIEEAAERVLSGESLTWRQVAILNSSQGHFAMGWVLSIQRAWARDAKKTCKKRLNGEKED